MISLCFLRPPWGWFPAAGSSLGLGEHILAKRFTETKKWTVWFRKLPPRLKCVHTYLHDHCDHAGLWDVDYETMSHYIGEPIDEIEVLEAFGRRIVRVAGGSKYWLPDFVLLQYKKRQLSTANNTHKSALELLAAVGITDWPIYLEPIEKTTVEPVQGLLPIVLDRPEPKPVEHESARRWLPNIFKTMPA